MTPETSLVTSVHRILKRYNTELTVLKLATRFSNGWPDALYIANHGKLLWVEYKVHPNTTSKIQDQMIANLRQRGQEVVIVTKMTKYYTLTMDDNPDHTITTTENPAYWIVHKLRCG